jgi:hypothetical protein
MMPESAPNDPTASPAHAPAAWDAELAALRFVEEGRRLQLEQIMWQVPAFRFAGQAFLFTVALAPGTSPVARILASLIGWSLRLPCSTCMSMPAPLKSCTQCGFTHMGSVLSARGLLHHATLAVLELVGVAHPLR